MNNEQTQNLQAVKAELKKGGTYFDTLVEAAVKAVIDAISRSPARVDLETAKSIGYDAAKQFLNHWVGGQDAEVPNVDPDNPLQKDANGVPAKIIHPSPEDNHEIPAFEAKLDGDVPAPPPGVPAAFTPEEEAAMLHSTGRPDNVAVLQSMNEKELERRISEQPKDAEVKSSAAKEDVNASKVETERTPKKK
jgi:hypothetical protein